MNMSFFSKLGFRKCHLPLITQTYGNKGFSRCGEPHSYNRRKNIR